MSRSSFTKNLFWENPSPSETQPLPSGKSWTAGKEQGTARRLVLVSDLEYLILYHEHMGFILRFKEERVVSERG